MSETEALCKITKQIDEQSRDAQKRIVDYLLRKYRLDQPDDETKSEPGKLAAIS